MSKFSEGQEVVVIGTERSIEVVGSHPAMELGTTGVISEVDLSDGTYEVEFQNDSFVWFHEVDLDLVKAEVAKAVAETSTEIAVEGKVVANPTPVWGAPFNPEEDSLWELDGEEVRCISLDATINGWGLDGDVCTIGEVYTVCDIDDDDNTILIEGVKEWFNVEDFTTDLTTGTEVVEEVTEEVVEPEVPKQVCVDASNYSLTEGKFYELRPSDYGRTTGSFVWVTDDNGEEQEVFCHRFEEVTAEEATKELSEPEVPKQVCIKNEGYEHLTLGKAYETTPIKGWDDEFVSVVGDNGELIELYGSRFEDGAEELTAPEAAPEPVEEPAQYIITQDSVTLTLNGNTEVATSDNDNFVTIRQMVMNTAYEDAMALMAPAAGIENWGQGSLVIDNGVVKYSGMELTGKLVDRIIGMMKGGDEAFERFAKFLSLTMEQVSFKTRERLMDFAAHDKLDLDEEGRVVAFKNVRDDYMDKHSGTFRNEVGDSPSMRRSDVDDNHDHQCSNGLHVCSPTYLKRFWGTSGKTMRVVVDPRDFVAIPYDYNDSKARVCKYSVVEDVTDNISDYL